MGCWLRRLAPALVPELPGLQVTARAASRVPVRVWPGAFQLRDPRLVLAFERVQLAPELFYAGAGGGATVRYRASGRARSKAQSPTLSAAPPSRWRPHRAPVDRLPPGPQCPRGRRVVLTSNPHEYRHALQQPQSRRSRGLVWIRPAPRAPRAGLCGGGLGGRRAGG